jgi:multicomponent Na+:H+ antiporter subunit A
MVPTILVVSVFLLVVGHDAPGGGFVGGLLAGAALLVVFLSGGRPETASIMPVQPATMIGSGMAVVVVTAIGGLVFGSALLDAGKLTLDMGFLGRFSLGSALLFDAGVYLVVVGLGAAVLAGLGDSGEVDS